MNQADTACGAFWDLNIMRSLQAAFTLVELMVTLVVLSVVLGFAVPSFGKVLTQNRITTQTNDFISALMLARSEAVRRGGQVTVLKTGTNWESGWKVFYDANEDEAYTYDGDGDGTPCEISEDCLIVDKSDALNGGSTLRVASGGNYASYIVFDSMGAASGSASGGSKDLRLCDSSATTSMGRTITLETTGRIRVSTGATTCP